MNISRLSTMNSDAQEQLNYSYTLIGFNLTLLELIKLWLLSQTVIRLKE